MGNGEWGMGNRGMGNRGIGALRETIVIRNADFIIWNFTTKTQKPRRNSLVVFEPVWFNPALSSLFN